MNFIDSYVSSHRGRSFKNKRLTFSEIIMQSFNFTYAGIVDVFIIYQRGKYYLCCSGFTYDGEVAFFGKGRHFRQKYETLYGAILAFHQVVNLFTTSMDWFTKDYFESCEFYNYADEELFK